MFDLVSSRQLQYIHSLITKQEKNLELMRQFIPFLIHQIFISDQFDYKLQNHQEKRIFSLDKPNKFMNDFRIKRQCYLLLHNIISSNDGIYSLEEYSLLSKGFQMADAHQIGQYADFITRDEYLYELLVNRIYHQQITQLFKGGSQLIDTEGILDTVYSQMSKYMIGH